LLPSKAHERNGKRTEMKKQGKPFLVVCKQRNNLDEQLGSDAS
jgi:hypothetical protein